MGAIELRENLRAPSNVFALDSAFTLVFTLSKLGKEAAMILLNVGVAMGGYSDSIRCESLLLSRFLTRGKIVDFRRIASPERRRAPERDGSKRGLPFTEEDKEFFELFIFADG